MIIPHVFYDHESMLHQGSWGNLGAFQSLLHASLSQANESSVMSLLKCQLTSLVDYKFRLAHYGIINGKSQNNTPSIDLITGRIDKGVNVSTLLSIIKSEAMDYAKDIMIAMAENNELDSLRSCLEQPLLAQTAMNSPVVSLFIAKNRDRLPSLLGQTLDYSLGGEIVKRLLNCNNLFSPGKQRDEEIEKYLFLNSQEELADVRNSAVVAYCEHASLFDELNTQGFVEFLQSCHVDKKTLLTVMESNFLLDSKSKGVKKIEFEQVLVSLLSEEPLPIRFSTYATPAQIGEFTSKASAEIIDFVFAKDGHSHLKSIIGRHIEKLEWAIRKIRDNVSSDADNNYKEAFSCIDLMLRKIIANTTLAIYMFGNEAAKTLCRIAEHAVIINPSLMFVLMPYQKALRGLKNNCGNYPDIFFKSALSFNDCLLAIDSIPSSQDRPALVHAAITSRNNKEDVDFYPRDMPLSVLTSCINDPIGVVRKFRTIPDDFKLQGRMLHLECFIAQQLDLADASQKIRWREIIARYSAMTGGRISPILENAVIANHHLWALQDYNRQGNNLPGYLTITGRTVEDLKRDANMEYWKRIKQAWKTDVKHLVDSYILNFNVDTKTPFFKEVKCYLASKGVIAANQNINTMVERIKNNPTYLTMDHVIADIEGCFYERPSLVVAEQQTPLYKRAGEITELALAGKYLPNTLPTKNICTRHS